ncbi:23S rRNA methyltransferase [Babesia microti strain RI]|uniref:23S rRNA methyltransferase n=1 Tax=Babesia microti (strain RI) TaxID=1133968 RepID=A0A1R4A9V2_BABMR|nr:23S rRNA methyltransferase [Babesia microti strain RI]SJK85777.1 23S rRNA methyltransferase [Babesia microti strain RI]|eukprot:XP_021337999.1 23S rRNA methyltransferase [Babesia microti strain RI]
MKNGFPCLISKLSQHNQSYRHQSTFKGFPKWIDTYDLNIPELNNVNSSVSCKHDKKSPLRIIRWKRNSLDNSLPDRKVANYFFRLRINRTLSKSQNKCLISSSQAIVNILNYSSVNFGLIYSTNRQIIDYIQNSFSGRYGKVCLCNQNFIDRVYMHTTFALSRSDVAAEAHIPLETDFTHPKRILVLDGLSYAQNVGMLTRTAISLGFDGLFVLNNSAKQFDWKVTCITKGFQFAFPYRTGDALDLANFCKEKNLIPLVAHVEGVDLKDFTLNPECGFCLVMGSEGNGPSKQVLEFAQKITLPGYSLIDSLNVAIAGGILMHQLTQLIRN